jgi:hypothetical protein
MPSAQFAGYEDVAAVAKQGKPEESLGQNSQ